MSPSPPSMTTAPGVPARLWLLAFLLAWAMLAFPVRASEPDPVRLTEDQVVRFIATLRGMAAARASDAGFAAPIEEAPDNPLLPFAQLDERDHRLLAAATSIVKEHGFAGLKEWLSIGAAVMEAYWSVSADRRMADLAEQLAPVALAMRGKTNPAPREIAIAAGELYDRMIERNRAGIAPGNLELAIKYQRRIAREVESRPPESESESAPVEPTTPRNPIEPENRS